MTWKTLSTNTLLARPPFLKVYQDSIEIREGEVIDDFYRIELRDFALVIPFLPDGRIQLIRQYKHGAGREVLSFPAGHVEAGEDPTLAARRELLEETGLDATRLISLGSYADHGNQKVCTGHYYVAPLCQKIAEPDPGDLEDFAYETLTPAEIDIAMRGGEFGILHHIAAWGLWKLQEAGCE